MSQNNDHEGIQELDTFSETPVESNGESAGKVEFDLENGGNEDEGNPSSNLVTWDGPNDPTNPRNWSFKRRWLATGLVSLVTFMTPIASSMIAPASDAIGNDLDVHSSIQLQLIFSIFLLAYVVGPFIQAPLSEIYGRVVVLQLANVFFLIFNFLCGFAQNKAEMLAFRFLSGLGACAPLTVGGGVLSDLWRPEERGMAIALYTLAPLLGPALGPLLGAWITERTTWRWCFYAVTIFGVIIQVLVYFTLPETFGPRILYKKVQKLRQQTGNEKLRTEFEQEDRSLGNVMRHSLIRVVILLTTQPIIIFLSVYMATTYGVIYIMLATFPTLWSEDYHESTGIGGLNYLAIMIGFFVGAQSGGRLVDFGYRRLKAKSPDNTGVPEFRVPILFLSTFLLSAGLFMYGWSAQKRTFWLVPDIGVAIFSIGASMTFTGLQTYTIDAYPLFAASAIGATAVARSLTGFSFPLFAPDMYDALRWGWGNSVLGFAILVIGYGGAFVLWFYGARLRAASPYAKGGK